MRLYQLLENSSRKALLACQQAVIEAGYDTELTSDLKVLFTVETDLEDAHDVSALADEAYDQIMAELKSSLDFKPIDHPKDWEVGYMLGKLVDLFIPDDLEGCYMQVIERT